MPPWLLEKARLKSLHFYSYHDKIQTIWLHVSIWNLKKRRNFVISISKSREGTMNCCGAMALPWPLFSWFLLLLPKGFCELNRLSEMHCGHFCIASSDTFCTKLLFIWIDDFLSSYLLYMLCRYFLSNAYIKDFSACYHQSDYFIQ